MFLHNCKPLSSAFCSSDLCSQGNRRCPPQDPEGRRSGDDIWPTGFEFSQRTWHSAAVRYLNFSHYLLQSTELVWERAQPESTLSQKPVSRLVILPNDKEVKEIWTGSIPKYFYVEVLDTRLPHYYTVGHYLRLLFCYRCLKEFGIRL